MSMERPEDPVTVNPSRTVTSDGGGDRSGEGDGDSRPGEFSPEQLVLIDRLITARVTAATAGTTVETPETYSSTGTGEYPYAGKGEWAPGGSAVSQAGSITVAPGCSRRGR